MKTVWVAILLLSVVFVLPVKGQENENDTIAALSKKQKRIAGLSGDSKRNFVAFDASYLLLSISYGRTIKGTQWGIGGGIGGYHRSHGYYSDFASIREYFPMRIFAVYDNSFFTCETGIRFSGLEILGNENDPYSEDLSYMSLGAYITPMIGWKNIKIGPVIAAVLWDLSYPLFFSIPLTLKYTYFF